MRPRLATRRKIELARLAAAPVLHARRLAGRGPELEATRGGIRWRLDLREGIDFAIWLLGSFEPGTRRAYSRLVRAGDVVLDVGANIGAHTLHFARLVGDAGRVIAFEPTAFAFRKLEANLRLNPALARRVSAERVALVGGSGERPPAEIYASWPLRRDPALHPVHRGATMTAAGARATTLDAHLAGAGVKRVCLIKLDVDGHEGAVLRGAARTLREQSPPILLELAPDIFTDAGSSIAEVLEPLAAASYLLCDLRGRPLPSDPTALVALIPAGGSINALARREP